MRNIKQVLLVAVLVLLPSLLFSATARYFAEVNKAGVVQRVIVADSQSWCEKNLGGTWVETFINSKGKNYAGKGYTYVSEKGNFTSPKLVQDATLDDSCIWHSPVVKEAVKTDTVIN